MMRLYRPMATDNATSKWLGPDPCDDEGTASPEMSKAARSHEITYCRHVDGSTPASRNHSQIASNAWIVIEKSRSTFFLGGIKEISLSHARQQSVFLLHVSKHIYKLTRNNSNNKKKEKWQGNEPGANQGLPRLKNGWSCLSTDDIEVSQFASTRCCHGDACDAWYELFWGLPPMRHVKWSWSWR